MPTFFEDQKKDDAHYSQKLRDKIRHITVKEYHSMLPLMKKMGTNEALERVRTKSSEKLARRDWKSYK